MLAAKVGAGSFGCHGSQMWQWQCDRLAVVAEAGAARRRSKSARQPGQRQNTKAEISPSPEWLMQGPEGLSRRHDAMRQLLFAADLVDLAATGLLVVIFGFCGVPE